MFLTDKNVSLTKSITRWFVVVEGMEGRSMKQRVLWVVIVILPTRRFNGTARVADRLNPSVSVYTSWGQRGPLSSFLWTD